MKHGGLGAKPLAKFPQQDVAERLQGLLRLERQQQAFHEMFALGARRLPGHGGLSQTLRLAHGAAQGFLDSPGPEPQPPAGQQHARSQQEPPTWPLTAAVTAHGQRFRRPGSRRAVVSAPTDGQRVFRQRQDQDQSGQPDSRFHASEPSHWSRMACAWSKS